MRKRKQGRKLSLKSDQRKALLKSLARALFDKEKIKTTEAKAKEVSIFAERMITEAKKKNLASLRRLSEFFSANIVKKLSTDIATRYAERKGGCTRIMKLGPRKSDGARMAIIELVK
jgi:large subunit ribosomal protein L17